MQIVLWDSSNGAGKFVSTGVYTAFRQPVPKKAVSITEKQYNAEGRAKRRKQNRHKRGWLPFAKR